MIELCSGHFRKGFIPNALASAKPSSKEESGSAAAKYLSSYLQMANYLRSSRPAASSPKEQEAEATPQPEVIPYDPPSPKVFFAHFAMHTEEFILFLESVALLRWGQQVDVEAPPPLRRGASTSDLLADADLEQTLAYEDEDTKGQRAIWNTLLELYLRAPEVD